MSCDPEFRAALPQDTTCIECDCRSTPDEFVRAFLDYVDRGDTDDLDFGRGLAASGLIERARAIQHNARDGSSHKNNAPSTRRSSTPSSSSPEEEETIARTNGPSSQRP